MNYYDDNANQQTQEILFSITCGDVVRHADGNTRVLYDVYYFSELTRLITVHMYNEFLQHPRFKDYVEMVRYDVDPEKLISRTALLSRVYNGTGRSFNYPVLTHDEIVSLLEAEQCGQDYGNYEPWNVADEVGVGLIQRQVEYTPGSYSQDPTWCQIQQYDDHEAYVGIEAEIIVVDKDDKVEEFNNLAIVKIQLDDVRRYTKAKIMVDDKVALAFAKTYLPFPDKLNDDPYRYGYCYFAFFKRGASMLIYGSYAEPPLRINRVLWQGINRMLRGVPDYFNNYVRFKVTHRNIHVLPDGEIGDYDRERAEVLWKALDGYFDLAIVHDVVSWCNNEKKFFA